jgi:ABC-type glycerol-3-phosphate transport system permease component
MRFTPQARSVSAAYSRAGARLGARRASVLAERPFLYALLFLTILVCDLPLVWMVFTAVKPEAEILHYPPTLYPHALSLVNFANLFKVMSFGTYLGNSAVVAVTTTGVTLVLGLFAAYAMVRFEFRFLRAMGELSLFTYMLPPVLLVVPVVQIVISLGLANNLLGLAVVYTAQQLPFALWMLRSYLRGITVELEQAAMVDGCTRMGAFLRVVVPEAVPGLIAVGVFTFNAAWSEYLYASILITTPERLTLAPGLTLFLNFTGPYSWGLLMAASVLATLPILVLFVLAQRQLVGAWGEGAVTG